MRGKDNSVLRLRMRLLLMFRVKIMWQAIRSGLKPEKDNFANIYLVVIPTVKADNVVVVYRLARVSLWDGRFVS